jgi:ABC-type branched-subunit amino acid transport system substrate-binding protein
MTASPARAAAFTDVPSRSTYSCFMTIPFSSAVRLVLIGVLGVLVVAPTQAQVQPRVDSIPRNPDAELMFEQGLAAFERGDYEQAAERFRLVNDYQLNRKTTAALVMQGKALLRVGRYEDAIRVLDTLLARYPDTSYRPEAEEVRAVARTRLDAGGGRADTLRLGIALPMDDEYVGLSQAMFNGIRLAIDRHNGLRRRFVPPPGLQADSFEVVNTADVYGDSLAEAEGRTTVTTAMDTLRVDSLRIVTEQQGRPDWVAKMHFRAVANGEAGARAAIDSLVQRDDVDVVLGPLFSRTARAAGAAAERARVPMVAPLATDASVSEGRQYVFQTNPPIPMRGRIMARFASESLLTESVSIIYEEGNTVGAQMARGFRAEGRAQGLQLPFTLTLNNPREWSRLPEALEADTTITDSMFAATEAVYLPIAGRNASGKIQDALTGMGRLNTDARVLGNSYWHNLTVKKEASAFTATYANDFNVQTGRPEVQAFIRNYRLLTGNTPDNLSMRGQRLAYTGYDIAQFLLSVLSPTPPGPGPDDLRTRSAYEGLGIRIHFRDDTVNRAMFFHRYRNNRIELLR